MPIRGSPNGAPLTLIHSPRPVDAIPRNEVDAIPRNEVDAINRYGWTPSIGIGGRHHSVRPAGLPRGRAGAAGELRHLGPLGQKLKNINGL